MSLTHRRHAAHSTPEHPNQPPAPPPSAPPAPDVLPVPVEEPPLPEHPDPVREPPRHSPPISTGAAAPDGAFLAFLGAGSEWRRGRSACG